MIQKHNEAMNLFEEALFCKQNGEIKEAERLFKKAFLIEKSVAMNFENNFENEPTRSILFRSASSIALNAGLFIDAENMASYGLYGNPPDEILKELLEIKSEVGKIIINSQNKLEQQKKEIFKTSLKLNDNSNKINPSILGKYLTSMSHLFESIRLKNKSKTELLLKPENFKTGSFSIEYEIKNDEQLSLIPNKDVELLMKLLSAKDSKNNIYLLSDEIDTEIISNYIKLLKTLLSNEIELHANWFNYNVNISDEIILENNTIENIIEILNSYENEDIEIEECIGYFDTVTKNVKKYFYFEDKKTNKLIRCKPSKELIEKKIEFSIGGKDSKEYKVTFKIIKKINKFKGLVREYILTECIENTSL